MKIKTIITCLILGIILFVICFDYDKRTYPNEFYNVYLDGIHLGVIKSKTELEKYINAKANHFINVEDVTTTYCEDDRSLEQIIQDENLQELIDNSKETKYYQNEDKKNCVDITVEDGEMIENVYTPEGINIEKTLTFSDELNTVEEVYSKIVAVKSFTIKGYQFTIKNDDKINYIYTINKDIFEQATNELIKIYVGAETYQKYLDDSQIKIETVGSLIENVYIKNNNTYVLFCKYFFKK